METIHEDRQKLLTELIAHSAKIDALVIKTKQADITTRLVYDQELQSLRAHHTAITTQLHAMEKPTPNAWENIGGGG